MREYRIRVGGKLHIVRVVRAEGARLILEVDGKTREVEAPNELRWGAPVHFKVDGAVRRVMVEEPRWTSPFQVYVDGRSFTVQLEVPKRAREGVEAPTVTGRPAPQKATFIAGAVTAPMPGRITSIKVREGDRVKEGDVLLILEAMKMENEIASPRSGVVREVMVKEGASVNRGDPLVVIS